MLVATGRFRVCRQGMGAREVRQLKAGARAYRGLRLSDTPFESWAELYEAAREDGFRINEDMMDSMMLITRDYG